MGGREGGRRKEERASRVDGGKREADLEVTIGRAIRPSLKKPKQTDRDRRWAICGRNRSVEGQRERARPGLCPVVSKYKRLVFYVSFLLWLPIQKRWSLLGPRPLWPSLPSRMALIVVSIRGQGLWERE